MFRYWILFSYLFGTSLQQKDPLRDFCRRFGSQSAVVDNRLYIDGGLSNWNPIPQNPKNFSNTWLLWHDLTQSPDLVGVAPLNANLSKNASIPAVSGGSFWADEVNKRLYLYGGEYLDVTPNQPELLSYDILNDQWQSEGRPRYSIGSVAWGGSAGVSELGRGYVMGGWMSNTSMPVWTGGQIASSYLLQYDMVSGDWQNRTGPDNIPKAEGNLYFLPVGNLGVLVYFGGVVTPYGNDTMEPLPLSTIYIYDIKSSEWYVEQATGDIPASRRRFCGGVGSAKDGSSHNIYIYGGMGFGANETGFDDVFILSLPSFKWVRFWQGDNPNIRHHSLTCNVINKGQMAVIGGSFPLTQACDSPAQWGVHNLDMGKTTGHPWRKYKLNITDYTVPPEVFEVVGGTPQGGATLKNPAGGFKNYDIGVYFQQRAVIPTRTPTRVISIATSSTSPSPTPSQKKSKEFHPGAIAGIAIGGAMFLFAIFLLAFFLIRRHRKKQEEAGTMSSQARQMSQTHSYQNSTYPPTSPYSPTNPHFSFPAPSYQLSAEPGPVELAATRTHEVNEMSDVKSKDGFPFHEVTTYEGEVSPQSIGDSPISTMGMTQVGSPDLSPHRGSLPSEIGTTLDSARGGSIGSLGRQISGVELVSPQLTVSSIEVRPSKFQNQTYYSP